MALRKQNKFLRPLAAVAASFVVGGLFNLTANMLQASEEPEPAATESFSHEAFWQNNNYTPLTKPQSTAYRAELVERFAKNNYTGKPGVADLCAAHSLALLEEKLEGAYPDKKALSSEESFYLSTQIMLLCARGERPKIS